LAETPRRFDRPKAVARLAEACIDRGMREYDPTCGFMVTRERDSDQATGDVMATLSLACGILHWSDDERRAAAFNMLEAVLAQQRTQAGHVHEGNFPWIADADMSDDLDFNVAAFAGNTLAIMLAVDPRGGADWPTDLRQQTLDALVLAAGSCLRRQVPATYSNIACLSASTLVLAGEMADRPELLQTGRQLIGCMAEQWRQIGAPYEFLSPTYAAVMFSGLLALRHLATDPEATELARAALSILWRHIARHYHAPTGQLGGAQSRCYDDINTGGVLWYVATALAEHELAAPPLPIEPHPMAIPATILPSCCPAILLREMAQPPIEPITVSELVERIGETPVYFGYHTRPPALRGEAPPPAVRDAIVPRARVIRSHRDGPVCIGSVNEIDVWCQRRGWQAFVRHNQAVYNVMFDVRVEAAHENARWLWKMALTQRWRQDDHSCCGTLETAPIRNGWLLGSHWTEHLHGPCPLTRLVAGLRWSRLPLDAPEPTADVSSWSVGDHSLTWRVQIVGGPLAIVDAQPVVKPGRVVWFRAEAPAWNWPAHAEMNPIMTCRLEWRTRR